MALLMETGSEPRTNDEIVDLEAISALKESAAIELKDKGNEYVKMGKKHYPDAIDCYTRAINQKALGDSEHSILYSNRAHVNLLLGNYRRALQDAEEASKLSPTNVKALFRAAKASLFLNLLDEANVYGEKGLQQSPTDEELKKLLKQIDIKKSEQESRKAGIFKAVAAAESLVSSLEDRQLKMGRAIYQELTGIKKPMLDKNNMLHWPVVLLYPEVMSSDIIEDTCETDMFSVHLDMMFSESSPPMPWDTGNEYTRDSLELYYEAGSGVCLSKKEVLRYLLEGTVASHLENLGTAETSAVNHTSAANGNGPKWVQVDERKTLHDILKGPDFIIAGIPVDEIVNISCPLRGRYQNAGPGIKRCLKLSMTDGVQRVFGFEYRPIKDLEVMAPAGLKIVLLNVNIRHGLLLLVPEVLEVLGGSVDELTAARQRLVNEINKPPRGKRTRTGVVPPLGTRATLAAWPPHNASVPGHADRTIRENTTSLPGSGQENPSGIPATNRHRQAYAVPGSGNNPESQTLSAPWAPERVNVVPRNDLHTSTPSQTAGKETEFITPPNVRPIHDRVTPLGTNNGALNSSFPLQPQEHCATPRNVNRTAGTPLMTAGQGTSFRTPVDAVFREDTVVSTSANVADPNASSTRQQEEFPGHSYGHMMEGTKPIEASGHDGHSDYTHGEDVMVPDNTKANPSSSVYMDVEEISLADDFMHPFIFSGEMELPFTYLASLSAKSTAIEDNASVIRGKIKCFLTGVKGFQYKKRTTYELRVYVDDGSLISEVLIDHHVVQRGIGFSPQEVSGALASSDARQVKHMKETLKQFQIFLVNFEGTMVVEMSKTSPVPVALEMTQGCSASDASLLLKRIKSSNSTPPKDCHLSPVDISP